jgi:zinc and cadmium transporter
MHATYALVSVFLVSIVSFICVFGLALREHWLRKTLLLLVSFAAGGLIGDAFIHLIPEAAEKGALVLPVLLGIVAAFVIEKFIHWHHCHHHEQHEKTKPAAYLNIFGDVIHNFVDGLVIAASYSVSVEVGIATTIAVILHEIPQEIGDFAILIHAGFSKAKALWYNFLTALSAIAGALVTLLIASTDGFEINLVGFAAGSFIYISLGDLVPELHKDTKLSASILQLVCFLAGIGFMALLLLIE